jgi:hypothetical protein
MSVTVDSVFADAMSLPDDAQADLLDRLLAAVGARAEVDLDREQMAVIDLRVEEILSGRVETIPGEEVLAEARARLRR